MIKVSFTRFSSIKSCSLSFPVMDPDFSDSFLNLSKTLLTSLFRLSILSLSVFSVLSWFV